MNHVRILSRLRGYRPRYADVAATLALLFAMSGTAYAVATVHTRDIVNAAVTTRKLHDGAVTSAKIAGGAIVTDNLADGAVTNAKLGDGSVSSSKLGDGSVTNFKLSTGVVTHSKLGLDSIDGSNVATNSLSLSDLVGANVTGAISFSLGANHCGSLTLGVSGAAVGQIAVFSFTGATTVPTSVVFGGAKVTAANTIVVRACNVSGSAMSVSNLGIHVATFG